MLSFVSVDVTTGTILADLEAIVFEGALKDTMARYESASASIMSDALPTGWRAATNPYSAAVICLDDDATTPLWGAIINSRQTDETGKVSITMATLPEYFDRRFVGTVSFTNRPQNLLVQDLVNAYIVNPPSGSTGMAGIPLRVQIEGGNGVNRTRSYADKDDKSVLSVLQDLSGVQGGPEWTIEWENVNNKITPVMRVGDHIGALPPAGLNPNVEFSLPGSVTTAQFLESYKSGDGANDVMAVSSGSADARPQSQHWRTTGDNRPAVEYRWSPSTSITDTSTLNAHAQRVSSVLGDGMVSLTLSASRQLAPSLGHDWKVGDTVLFDLTAGAWPNGLSGTARVVGYDMDENTISPILFVDQTTIVWS